MQDSRLINKHNCPPIKQRVLFSIPPHSWEEITITHRNSIFVLHNAAEG